MYVLFVHIMSVVMMINMMAIVAACTCTCTYVYLYQVWQKFSVISFLLNEMILN